jgi:uncharacterized membrane protein
VVTLVCENQHTAAQLSRVSLGGRLSQPAICEDKIAVPRFGFLSAERTARWLWLLSGAVGLVLALSSGRTWLIVQSVVVLAGVVGTFVSVFTLSAIGVLAGLFFATSVGVITFFPSLWILVLVLRRRRAFAEFTPRGPRFASGDLH